jgi:hypothetical protein
VDLTGGKRSGPSLLRTTFALIGSAFHRLDRDLAAAR